MKAWLLDRLGNGIQSLRIADVPDPQPLAGEIVLQLQTAAINPADWLLADNQYPARPTLPHILGRDGFGTIEAVGPDVDLALIGERRIILPSAIGADRPGTLAERVVVPLSWTAPPPADASPEQSAAAPLVYLTAWQSIMQWGEIPPGVVLVSGATGGVGVAAVQLAKSMGHIVIGFSRSSQKSQQLRTLGADGVLKPDAADWKKELLAMTGGQRVNLYVDSIGGELFSRVLDAMAPEGRISVVGQLAGPVPEFNTAALLFRRIRIGGVIVTGYSIAERQSIWSDIRRRIKSGRLNPVIDSVHPFLQVPAAFAALQQGPMGKVVITIPE